MVFVKSLFFLEHPNARLTYLSINEASCKDMSRRRLNFQTLRTPWMFLQEDAFFTKMSDNYTVILRPICRHG